MTAARAKRSDIELLAELAALHALADESDPCWSSDDYWLRIAEPYLALADLVATRKLHPAIRLLLDRACYGDPGEIMRGLRHNLEAIANPDWWFLAEECLQAAQSPRLGTRLWAIDELSILEDPRARPIFEMAIENGPEDIRWTAQLGLERLSNKH